jgi:hypothetical protein
MVTSMAILNTFRPTSVGLLIEGNPSQEEWIRFVRSFANKQDSIHWVIGDWLNYGIDHYNLNYEKAAQLLNEQGFSFCIQTLRNDKYVATSIPLSCRHDELSWQHHKEVASLTEDQQLYWLSHASEMGLSTKELRNAIKGSINYKWLRISDIWDFEKKDEKYGIDSPFHIPSQIVQNLIFYYSKPNAFIIDPLAVDGTTLDVCNKCPQTRRKCLAFDIEPLRQDVLKADATKPWPVHQLADFIFINTKRPNILRYSQEFGSTVRKILGEAVFNLKSPGILSIFIEPRNKYDQNIDWSFEVFQWVKNEMNLKFVRRIIFAIPPHDVKPAEKADAKKNNEVFSRTLEVLIFRKAGVRRCSRCGILIKEQFTDIPYNNMNGNSLCLECQQKSQPILCEY